MVYSFRSFQCQQLDWKARLISSLPLSSPPPLSSGPLLSLTAHDFFNLSLYFQEITSGSAELTFSPLFFSILSFIVFPLSSRTVVSHLPWPSCHASGQGANSQSGWLRPILCFFSSFVSFVFMFHLHPALACETFIMLCYTQSLCSFGFSPHLRISHRCSFFPSKRSASVFMEVANSSLLRL